MLAQGRADRNHRDHPALRQSRRSPPGGEPGTVDSISRSPEAPAVVWEIAGRAGVTYDPWDCAMCVADPDDKGQLQGPAPHKVAWPPVPSAAFRSMPGAARAYVSVRLNDAPNWAIRRRLGRYSGPRRRIDGRAHRQGSVGARDPTDRCQSSSTRADEARARPRPCLRSDR